MAVPNLKTWKQGELANEDMLNDQISDVVNFLKNPPMCLVTRSNALLIPHNVFTPMTWNFTLRDTDNNMFDGPSNIVTIRTSGLYSISYTALFLPHESGVRGITVDHVGVKEPFVRGGAASSFADQPDLGVVDPVNNFDTNTTARLQAYRYLVVGDQLATYAFQNSGTTLSVYSEGGSSYHSWFCVRWVAAT